jgi:hypothetical protein
MKPKTFASQITPVRSSAPVSAPSQHLQKRDFAPTQDVEEDVQEDESPDVQAKLEQAPPLNPMPLYPEAPVVEPAMVVQRRRDNEDEGDGEGGEMGRWGDGGESVFSSIQAKLTVGQPGDRYEQEADQMAAQVMRMPDEEVGEMGRWGVGEMESKVQRRGDRPSPQPSPQAAQETSPQVTSNFEQRLASKAGGGRPLSAETRAFMEPRFNASFESVRIHTDPELTSQIQAQAFTHGQDIFFNAGKYDPESSSGKELLAHELTHTLQQTQAIAPKTIQRREFGDDIRFDSLPGSPLQARVLGPYSDEAIAEALYGDSSVPITHAPESHDIVLVDYERLRAEWRGSFSVDSSERDSDARAVLDFIKRQARERAQTPYTISTSSRFFTRLRDFYLRDYLANPTAETGEAAVDRIGRPMAGRVEPILSEEPEYEGTFGAFGLDDTPSHRVTGHRVMVTPQGGEEREAGNRWEEGAIQVWNHESIPEIPDIPLFRNLRGLPRDIGAATDILIEENTSVLPFIDVPFLLGGDNSDRSDDMADVRGGGRNISQLMHWATGVANAEHGEDALHELFLLYEMWHLEGWDVFAEDPINDLIAEEQGRLLGEELAQGGEGAIRDEASLATFLNSSFQQARAWVGTLLHQRETELEQWILAETQPRGTMHWDEANQRDMWQGRPSISQMVRDGMGMDEILASPMVNSQIEIYRLIYEAEIWEQTHGEIELTELEQSLLRGDLNELLSAAAQGNLTSAAIAISQLEEEGSP